MYDKTLRLCGEKVTLLSLSEEHTSLIVQWRNSPEVIQNLYNQSSITEESHLSYFQAQVVTGRCVQFVIYINADNVPVGSVFLKNIDPMNRRAEYGVFIGEAAARGKGYGSEAAHLILKYGFNSLGLNRIYLSVLSDNPAAIASYEKAGFRKEGLLRQDFFRQDRYLDVVLMAKLANEIN